MKIQITKLLIAFVFIISISSLACFAQVPPQAISYQAVARDNNGNIISNQTVSLRFIVHDSIAAGAIVYQETQSATTNVLGLVNLSIGTGTVVSGTFAGINWGSNPKFLQVEIDPTGGTNYTNLGTSQMLSVPYALYAGNGGSGGSGTTGQSVIEVDGTAALSLPSTATTFTVMPGLTSTINVPDSAQLLILGHGYMTNGSTSPNSYFIGDIGLFQDGTLIGTPAYARVTNLNTQTFVAFTEWNIHYSTTIPAGSHTFDLRGVFVESSGGNSVVGSVSGGSADVLQGNLIITIIKK